MTLLARVHTPSDPTLDQVREAVAMLVSELSRHLDTIGTLPAGPTSFAQLADLNEPVRRALARWDEAVFAHTETLPIAIDDGWGEDFID